MRRQESKSRELLSDVSHYNSRSIRRLRKDHDSTPKITSRTLPLTPASQKDYSLFSRDFFEFRLNSSPVERIRNPLPNADSLVTVNERKNPLLTLYESRRNVPNNAEYSVVKLLGVPWNLTIEEVEEFLHPIKVPRKHEAPHYTESVHIILNRQTGRTLKDCFIEFPDENTVRNFLRDKPNRKLAGRSVRVLLSTQDELMNALFPSRQVQSNISEIADGTVFMIRDECFFLVNACRSIRYKPKSPTRPYENIISILTKVPWHDPELISTLQRDHFFEMVKLSMEAIKHTIFASEYRDLIIRLVRAALCVPLFTERQKQTILNTAHINCPTDLEEFVYVPNDPEVNSGVSNPIVSVSLQQTRADNQKLLNELNELTEYTNKLQNKYEAVCKDYDELAAAYELLKISGNRSNSSRNRLKTERSSQEYAKSFSYEERAPCHYRLEHEE